MGDKISGALDKMVGKATGDPAKVAEGEAKSKGVPTASTGAHTTTGATY